MKLLVRPKPGRLEIVERKKPTRKAETDVLIQIQTIGICGGDLTYFRGTGHTFGITEAFVVCHEAVGVVLEGPQHLLGRNVVIDPLITCGFCDNCAKGKPQLCGSRKDMGYGADGVAAELLVVPESRTYLMSENLSLPTGVLVHGLAAVLHSLSKVLVDEIPKTAAVYGPGPAGLMFAIRLKELGVDVTLVGRNSWRLDLAQELGIRVARIGQSEEKEISTELVIETTGSSDVQEEALNRVAPGGTLLLYAPGTFKVEATKVFRRELKIIGATGAIATMQKAMDILALNPAPYESLLTHDFPMSSGQEAFDLATAEPATRGEFLKASMCLD
jgi:threonine dehydrogenase-like Zn-dependent dehydrogenase